MFKALKCARRGHLFVDSRSQPGTQVCVRCQHRQPFEGLATASMRNSDAGNDPSAS